MSNEIVLLPQLPAEEDAMAVFAEPGGLKPFVEHVRSAVKDFAPDVSTAKGRAEVKSMAYAVTRSKTALDGLGKKLVDQLKDLPKKIDAHRKAMRDELDALAEQVRKPLTEWEEQEALRKRQEEEAKAKLEAAIQKLVDAGNAPWGTTAATLQERIAKLMTVPCDAAAWGSEEAAQRATKARDTSLTSLRKMLQDRTAFEAQQHELQLQQAQMTAQMQHPAATPAAPNTHAHDMLARGVVVHPAAEAAPPAANAQALQRLQESERALQQFVGLTPEQANAVMAEISMGNIPHVYIDV